MRKQNIFKQLCVLFVMLLMSALPMLAGGGGTGSSTYKGGEQTASVNVAQLKNGVLQIEAVELGEGVSYFKLKGNPDHFKTLKAGIGTSAKDADYSIDLLCSPEGSINIYPTLPSGQKLYYKIEPKPGIVYSFNELTYVRDTYNYPYLSNQTVEKSYAFLAAEKLNGKTLVLTSGEKLAEGAEWSITIKADPESVAALQDGKDTSAQFEVTTDGYLYTTTKDQAQIKLKSVAASPTEPVIYNSYFYLAGADTNDHSQAYMYYQTTAKNTTSFLTSMVAAVSGAYANGGTLVIETVKDPKITVNISGNKTNYLNTFKMTMGAKVVELKEGANKIDLKGKILQFERIPNTDHIGYVKRNGTDLVEQNATGDGGGGTATYYYSVQNAADGDVYDILVDALEVNRNVYIEVSEGCEDYITKVTVNGETVEWTPGEPLSVLAGKTVRVEGDTYNFKTIQSLFNGEPTKNVGTSQEQVVKDDDMTFGFVVERIARDKSITLTVGSSTQCTFITAQGSVKKGLTPGTYTIPVSAEDNPVEISSKYTGSSQQEQVAEWTLNGVLAAYTADLKYKATDGDALSVEQVAASNANNTCNVAVSLADGIDNPTIIADGAAQTSPLFVVSTNSAITISSNNDVKVTGVVANNTEVEAVDGVYTVDVEEEATSLSIAITGVSAPKFTLNVHGDYSQLWAIDANNDLLVEQFEQEENVIVISDEFVAPYTFVANPMSGEYCITAISYNGTDIYQDANYYTPVYNGFYTIDVQPGDEIELTVAPFSRDKVLNIYIDGYEMTKGCNVAALYGDHSLVENENGTLGGSLKEGKNVVRFADSDLPLRFNLLGLVEEGLNFTMLLDDTEVEYTEGEGYMINCADGQNLYIIVSTTAATEPVNMGKAGVVTYSSHNDIEAEEGDEVDYKVYIVTGYDPANGGLNLERVTGTVPAGTGVLVVAKENTTQDIKLATTAGSAAPKKAASRAETPNYEQNMLIPAYKYATIPAADETYDCYTFGEKNGKHAFHLLDAETTADKNMAYLLIPKDEQNEKVAMLGDLQSEIDRITTGVESIIVNGENAAVYNTLGVKVADSISDKSLKPGIYIVGGKKVLIRK